MSRGKWTFLRCSRVAELAFVLAATAKGFHDGFASLSSPPLSSRANSLLISAMISLGLAFVITLMVCIQTDYIRSRRGSAP